MASRAAHRRPHVIRGFTLIELLVVISIIALLIAILLPALSAARESSRQVTCLSNLRSMAIGSQLYFHENNDQIFPMRWSTSGLRYWSSILWPYAGGTTYVWNLPPHPEGGYVEGMETVFRCPTDDVMRPQYAVKNISYSAGWYTSIDMSPTGFAAAGMGTPRLRRVVEFPHASSVGFLGDWDPRVDLPPQLWQGISSPARRYLSLPMWMRHGGGENVNYAYLDGHAATIRRPDLMDQEDALFTGMADPLW